MKNQINHDTLRTIFNSIDPVGLIDPETPESLNEYDPEVRELISRTVDFKNQEDIRINIEQIFVQYFEGVPIDHGLLSELARKIHENYL